MARHRSRKATCRPAATAVEFALVSLVFFTLILAAVELGRGLMTNYLLITTARQACRSAVPTGRTSADVQSAANDALQRAGLPATTVVVLVNGVQADAAAAGSGDLITVSLTLPISQVSWVPGTRYLSGSLGGSYSLRRE